MSNDYHQAQVMMPSEALQMRANMQHNGVGLNQRALQAAVASTARSQQVPGATAAAAFSPIAYRRQEPHAQVGAAQSQTNRMGAANMNLKRNSCMEESLQKRSPQANVNQALSGGPMHRPMASTQANTSKVVNSIGATSQGIDASQLSRAKENTSRLNSSERPKRYRMSTSLHEGPSPNNNSISANDHHQQKQQRLQIGGESHNAFQMSPPKVQASLVHQNIGSLSGKNPRKLPERPQQTQYGHSLSKKRVSGDTAGFHMDGEEAAQDTSATNLNFQPPNQATVIGLGLGMGIQMGKDGRFYASMGGVTMNSVTDSQSPTSKAEEARTQHAAPQQHQQLSPRTAKKQPYSSPRLKRQFDTTAAALTGDSLQPILQTSQLPTSQRYPTQVASPKVSRGNQSKRRVSKHNKHTVSDSRSEYEHIFQSVTDETRQKLMQRTSNNQNVPLTSGAKDESPLAKINSPKGSDGPHASNIAALIENTQIQQAQGSGQAPPKSTQLNVAKHQKMNSTTESCFTEQPVYSGQLLGQTLDVAANSSFTLGQNPQAMATNRVQAQVATAYLNQNGGSNMGMPQGGNAPPNDGRPYILMKNKVEENSKQLKHEVAQQIIAANTTSAGTATSRINSHHNRKTSLVQGQVGGPQQTQLPQLRHHSQPKSDLNAPSSIIYAQETVDSGRQQNQVALKMFYQQITNDQISTWQPSGHKVDFPGKQGQLHGPSSQLSKNTAKSLILEQTNDPGVQNRTASVLQKHNSVEHLLANKAASRNQINMMVPAPYQQTPNNAPNYTANGAAQTIGQVVNASDYQTVPPYHGNTSFTNQQDPSQFHATVSESGARQGQHEAGQNSRRRQLSQQKQPQGGGSGLTYRVMSEKRASQPPLLSNAPQVGGTPQAHAVQDSSGTGVPASVALKIGIGGGNLSTQRQLLSQHVEHVKRNSIQVMVPQHHQQIMTQEVNLEDANQQVMTQQRFKGGHHGHTEQQQVPQLTAESAEWIRQAIEASKQAQNAGNNQTPNQGFLVSLQEQERNKGAGQGSPGKQYQNKQGQQFLSMGIPKIQGPSSSTNFEIESPKRPDLTESNMKRSRLLIEKKRKQFEQMKSGSHADPKWRLNNNEAAPRLSPQQLAELHIAQHEQMEQELFQKSGILIGSGITADQVSALNSSPAKQGMPSSGHKSQQQNGFICVPNIAYKAILPAQQQSSGQKIMANIKLQNMNHPLNCQQLMNGYQKNTSVPAPPISKQQRKAHQERAFKQNQGIQGKNITILTQNKAVAQQISLMRSMKSATKAEEDSQDAAFFKALESKLSPEDVKTLQLIHQLLQKSGMSLNSSSSRKNLLQAMHAAETGQAHLNNSHGLQVGAHAGSGVKASSNQAKGSSSFFQFGVARQDDTGKLVVFNNRINQSSPQQYSQEEAAKQMRGDQDDRSEQQKMQQSHKSPLLSLIALQQSQQHDSQSPASLSGPGHGVQQPPSQSNASYMADQMVQTGLGQRSLSKILQGAQLEATLQQLAKMGAFNMDDPETQHYLQMISLGGNRMQQVQQQQSPRSVIKVRGKAERLASRAKFASPTKGGSRQGESNGSLSTKPATSTTLNSTSQKNSEETKLGHSQTGKKTARGGKKEPQKQRVKIWHETDEPILKSHKINKAINTINNIIRLIFKNNKDSLAITTTNQSNSLSGPPANRLMEDYRITELQKIAKQINISIPRKFDSKSSLREFFYSREFILNVKIKMQNLLHKAILSANNLHQSVIEANMCGNLSVAAKEGGAAENKIYQAKKFWVGQGNNFPIVKSVLKQRYWWQYGSEESFGADCDFIWTSWKKQKHIDFLGQLNTKQKAKAEKRSIQLQNALANADPSASATAASVSEKANETDQKLSAAQSETKMSRKKKEKAQEAKEPTQAQLDRIVLPLKLYNRLEQNKQLTNKKGVFVNMRKYYESHGQDPFKVLPLTFHTSEGISDPEYHRFVQYYNNLARRQKASEAQTKAAIKEYYAEKKDAKNKKKAQKLAGEEPADADYDSEVDSDDEDAIEKIKRKYRAPQNTWIIKPGENTNRGIGITVVKTIKEVQSIIGRTQRKDGERTFIIQKYIDYPLLVHKRKFDFRCFGLMTSINGSLKGYCYQDGYIRTSCREYSLDDVSDPFIHLTNDAIQQKADDYGKFENGNKLSWQDFTKVICAQQPELDFDFHRDIFPQIQKLIADTFKAAFHKIDPQRLQNSFELFGYDFMIDEDFRLYLIEVNTNPCLEVCCPLIARIIPEVLDNSFKIVLDPLFPSPDLSHNRKFQLNELPQEVKFQLVFDEDVEGEQIRANYLRGVKGSIKEEDIESDKEQELAEDDGDADAY